MQTQTRKWWPNVTGSAYLSANLVGQVLLSIGQFSLEHIELTPTD
jgi:hypothetical protein